MTNKKSLLSEMVRKHQYSLFTPTYLVNKLCIVKLVLRVRVALEPKCTLMDTNLLKMTLIR